MGRRAGQASLACALAGMTIAVAGCAGTAGATEHGALPGQSVGLAAIAGSGPAGTATSALSAPTSTFAVTVPELTNAGTIANLTAPPVTVPASTSGSPAPAPPPPEVPP